ncbi:hypothetical protein BDZ91DRAFT_796939 [Kalaharituber pfeilii]|nr:hypothetical protein BDZ91DRAFT_796939 [Kalaharituber pfeilii]
MRNTVAAINTIIKGHEENTNIERHDEDNTVIERHDEVNSVIERHDKESSVIERYGEVEVHIIESNESHRIQELNEEVKETPAENSGRKYRNPC